MCVYQGILILFSSAHLWNLTGTVSDVLEMGTYTNTQSAGNATRAGRTLGRILNEAETVRWGMASNYSPRFTGQRVKDIKLE